MKLNRSSTVLLLATMEFVFLAAAPISLAQTDLNAQLRQALCAQNWGQALDTLDRMKRAAGREYASQITLYRSRIQVLARENVKLSRLTDACSTSSPLNSAPANNSTAPAPSINMPPAPSGDIPRLPIPNLPPPPPL
jgi:hypothetical protein